MNIQQLFEESNMGIPIRLFVVLQGFASDGFARVAAGEDRVHDARRSPSPWICTLEWLPELEYGFGMTLKAIIHPAAAGGFWAEVPALPGCLTQAETLDELHANLREAIQLWLSVDDETMESNANDSVLELTV